MKNKKSFKDPDLMMPVLLMAIFCGLFMLIRSAAGAEEPVNQQYLPGQIIVRFHDHVSKRMQMDVLQTVNAQSLLEIRRPMFRVVKVREDSMRAVIERIEQHPAVAYAEPNYIRRAFFEPNDEYYSDEQWNFDLINMADAWDISTGSGVTVAVIDTGVNPNGYDGFGGRVQPGYNAILGIQSRWEDDHGHGTHVAGTIAQETDNYRGVAGIAFDAHILPVKVLNRRGFGSSANIIDGIMWAVDHGADIINMSLGSELPSQAEHEAVLYALEKGVLIIAASGNSASSIIYPAAYDEVIAVGAVDPYKTITDYSCYGPEQDIVAPGGGYGYDGVLQETFRTGLGFSGFAFGWSYYFLSGTSMASPHVAAVAALVKSLHPEWSTGQIRAALTGSAEDLGDPGRDDVYGYGLLNAYEAVMWDGKTAPEDPGKTDPGKPEKPDTSPEDGAAKAVNLFNNLVWADGTSLTATLHSDQGTWSAQTSVYSGCENVQEDICYIELYIDGEYQGYFDYCFDIEGECGSDATFLLGVDGYGSVFIELYCVEYCGQDIFSSRKRSGEVISESGRAFGRIPVVLEKGSRLSRMKKAVKTVKTVKTDTLH